jgi:hypothetical protein
MGQDQSADADEPVNELVFEPPTPEPNIDDTALTEEIERLSQELKGYGKPPELETFCRVYKAITSELKKHCEFLVVRTTKFEPSPMGGPARRVQVEEKISPLSLIPKDQLVELVASWPVFDAHETETRACADRLRLLNLQLDASKITSVEPPYTMMALNLKDYRRMLVNHWYEEFNTERESHLCKMSRLYEQTRNYLSGGSGLV